MPFVDVIKYVPANALGTTESGDALRFTPSVDGLCAAIQLKVDVSVDAPLPEEHTQWLRLDVTIADADGRLWRTTDVVPSAVLFDHAVRYPVYARAANIHSRIVSTFAPPWDRIEIRPLAENLLAEADSGLVRPLFVLRERADCRRDRDRFETLVYRLHEHTFHARLDLVEVTHIREQPKPCRLLSTHLLIRPLTSPTTSTAIDKHGEPVRVDRVDLSELGPLSSEIRLSDYIWRDRWSQVERPDGPPWWDRMTPPVSLFRRAERRGEPNASVSLVSRDGQSLTH